MSSTLQDPFPVWGFIITMVIVISFARERKTAPNDYAPELLIWIVQNPTKLSDKIWLTKNDLYEKNHSLIICLFCFNFEVSFLVMRKT